VSPRAVALVAAAGLLLILGCGHAQNLVTSGVQGRVLERGGLLVLPDATTSPRPYTSTEIAIWDPSGALVAKVNVGRDGRFKIALAPGRYKLVPRPTVGNPSMSAKEVTVIADRFTSLIVWAQVR
jgi:hypothetical protein